MKHFPELPFSENEQKWGFLPFFGVKTDQKNLVKFFSRKLLQTVISCFDDFFVAWSIWEWSSYERNGTTSRTGHTSILRVWPGSLTRLKKNLVRKNFEIQLFDGEQLLENQTIEIEIFFCLLYENNFLDSIICSKMSKIGFFLPFFG